MPLPIAHEIPFVDPFQLFASFEAAEGALFFDSAQFNARTGRFSYVMADPFEVLRLDATDLTLQRSQNSSSFARLQSNLQSFELQSIEGLPPFQGGAAGFMAYDLCHQLEEIPAPQQPHRIHPDLCLGFYDLVYAFDHQTRESWIFSSGRPEINEKRRIRRARAQIAKAEERIRSLGLAHKDNLSDQSVGRVGKDDSPIGPIRPIHSNFTRPAYEAAVQRVIDYIEAGDIFQANVSQRFQAELAEGESPLDLYARLRQNNPAPFAGYQSWGRTQILSASPERFVRLRRGRVETRPIKGTRPRGADKATDEALAKELLESEKDRAENVMIVDLLRNDLSRVCRDHSVETTELCALESYATVHHLVSAVEGRLRNGLDAVDLLAASFPGGSITGAPKVRAMEIIHELEPTRRGPYCGSLLWLGFDGSMDSSIVIRTYTLHDREIHFQAGGGIVADSVPALEYEETLDKAAALIRALDGRLE